MPTAGVIKEENIKWYYPDDVENGGVIDTNNEITSGVNQNIFPNVTNQERLDGATHYRKVFVRNENEATYTGVKSFIYKQSEAENDTITIALGTDVDVVTDAEGYTFYEPLDLEDADALDIGNLDENEYHGIWLKRTVAPSGDGFTNVEFILAVSST